MRSNAHRFALAIGLSGLAAGANAAAVPAPTLSDQITVVANRVPAGSSSAVYEAQFAALVDRTGATCTQVHDAALTTTLPRVAYVALQRLNQAATACSGTGAIGGGRANNLGVPGFSVGGGSDYVR